MSASGKRPAFVPDDPLGIDAELTAEQLEMRSAVRAVCRDFVDEHIGEWFENGDFPRVREISRELGKLGVFGMHLQGYGCPGMSAVDYGVVCAELEGCDSGLRSLVSVQGSLAMYAIWRWGSAEHKQRWLPAMAAGEALGCFGLTEPDHGSDPGSMRTTARRVGSDWVLTGRKMWITNGSVADVAIVWANTDDGVRGFVVPTDTPGFSAPEIKHKLSLRASITSELVLDEVRVPAEAALPEVTGLRGPLSCLNEARYGIIWGASGAADACLRAARDYATSREQFGRPIAGFQLTQAKLADMAVRVQNARLLALHLGTRKDAGTLLPQQISFGKLDNVRGALEVARSARTILGANGISLEYPVIRHMTNLESVLTYEGTAEMHQLTIGQALTGQAAFRD